MVLSRAFCLILGTSLFVMIWTMQDGNHRPARIARGTRSRAAGPATAPELHLASATQVRSDSTRPAQELARSSRTSEDRTTSVNALWMFADEPTVTQIAEK